MSGKSTEPTHRKPSLEDAESQEKIKMEEDVTSMILQDRQREMTATKFKRIPVDVACRHIEGESQARVSGRRLELFHPGRGRSGHPTGIPSREQRDIHQGACRKGRRIDYREWLYSREAKGDMLSVIAVVSVTQPWQHNNILDLIATSRARSYVYVFVYV